LVIKINSNDIYVNQKKVESVSNINNASVIEINNNKKIQFYFKKSRCRKIAHYFPLFRKKFKKTKYVLDITFIKEKTEDVNKLLNHILQQKN
jgi:phage anti-repressor protein